MPKRNNFRCKIATRNFQKESEMRKKEKEKREKRRRPKGEK